MMEELVETAEGGLPDNLTIELGSNLIRNPN